MIYYAKGNKLYATDVPFTDDSFREITRYEYNERVTAAVNNREQGSPILNDKMFEED